ARFPHQAHDLPRHQIERDAVHGPQRPFPGLEFRGESLDAEYGPGHLFNLGLSTSRRRSPTMLMDTMISSSATPEYTLIQYRPGCVYWLRLAISSPRDGSVRGTPRPRRLSVASSAIARALCMVPMTMMGGRQLGNRWRSMRRAPD